MATTNTLKTTFTPTGDFVVQSTGGAVLLMRKQPGAASFAGAGRIDQDGAYIVRNPIAGCSYEAVALTGVPVFQADYA